MNDQSNEEIWHAIYNVPDDEIWDTRMSLKKKLVDYIREKFTQTWLKNQGDPSRVVSLLERTFHFKSNSSLPFDFNEAITLHHKDTRFWKAKLNSTLPDVSAMALRQLQWAGAHDVVNILKDAYLKSNAFVVRMEAIKLLALFHPLESVSILPKALNDSYELVRRLSMAYAQRNGDPQLIPAVVKTYLQRGYFTRV